MSIASISYGSLRDAASEARDVAKKLDKYADSINSSVYKKLNNYEGTWTGNITTARSKASAKISDLRYQADKYRDYANELNELKSECESVDKAVRSKVSSLTASFKAAHGINNNVVVNTISYFFTSIGNSTKPGRWLNEKSDQIESGMDYLKEKIEDWYDYNGGKEVIKGIAVAVLEIAIAVVGVVLVFLGTVTGVWAVIVAIASVVGGVIAFVNGVTNLVNECRAYGYASDDPATAKRKSDLNTLSDTMRVESDSKVLHAIAGAWDVVGFVCTAITFVNSVGKLVGNGVKWIKQIDFKKVFSKDLFVNLKDMYKTFKAGGGDWFKALKADIFKNLKNEYWNFTEVSGDFSLLKTLKSTKNLLGIPKDLISGGFSLDNIGKVALDKLVFPALTLGAFEGDDVVGFEVGNGGQMQFDFTENITIDDVSGLIEKGIKLFDTGTEAFGGADINIDLSNIQIKFEEMQPIDISIPVIPMPNINVGYSMAV